MATGSRRSLSASVNGWIDGGDKIAWNYNCDFNGPVFQQFQMGPEQCGPTCRGWCSNNLACCTHFVHRDGICYLKAYNDRRGNLNGPNYPVTWNEPSRICGFITW